ncbi:1,4-alpha-glucan branching enzyme [Streptomyces sp. NPDC050508]|uniref:1,4-alpha-glucan branching enzyme n=1 Tax=Streptomyces sp. NPDC050508 TaxID=3155405 RepID=UPI00342322A8
MTPRPPSNGPDPKPKKKATDAAKKAAGEKATVKGAAAEGAAVKKAAKKKTGGTKKAGTKKAAAKNAVAKTGSADETSATRAATEKAMTKTGAAKTGVAKRTNVTAKVPAETGSAETGSAEEVAAVTGSTRKAVTKKAAAKKGAGKKSSSKKGLARKTIAADEKSTRRTVTADTGMDSEAASPEPEKADSPAMERAGSSAPEQTAAAPETVSTPEPGPTSEPAMPPMPAEAAEPTTSSTARTAPAPAVSPTPADTSEPATPLPPSNGPEPTTPPNPPTPSAPNTPTPSSTPTPSDIAVSPALDATDRDRLLRGTHHAPHSVLGAHPVPGGVAFRVFRPFALGVTVVAGQLKAELHDDGDGFFSGLLPLRGVPEYRLDVAYEGTVQDTEDAYRFLPALGDLDLHLIGEGRHEELWQALGARPMTHQGVTGTRFTVWAPDAQGVRVAGTFNFWDGTGAPMRSLGGTGVWELFMPGIGEGELYKFEITRPDGSKTMRADPMARRTEVPPSTSSIVTASHYEWNDAEWIAQRPEVPAHEAPFSVYEMHLASWRPGLTYRQLAEQLPAYIKDLGFTHVELMPVAEHPFGGSWGYQVTGFYAPTARLGTPDDFKFLVDALHQAGIGVLMDWVPAHFPRDDWALAEFDGRPLYEHEDPLRAAHPDWGTLEFDFGRREVRNFLVANAVYWCEEFHIDGLRVDAVASMLYLDYSREPDQWTPNEHGGRENLDAVAFLQEMNATVYRRVPGVVTIAEESTAWDGVTRATHHIGPGGFGGLGFGLKWNMGWMHDSLDYMSHEPVHRKFHHHEMTFSMVYAYSENYVLPISHDEVVHGKRSLVSKMPGDWWQQRANHRAYLAFMWAHPGKQLLFMGQEFAQGAEWSETHGPDWWLLDPAYGAEADHRGVRDLVRDLNTVYRHTPALWQLDTDPAGFQWVTGDAAEDNILAFLRYDADGSPLLAISNFSPVVRHDYRLGVPDDIPAWHEALNTDTARYGGGDVTNPDPIKPEPQPWHGRPTSIRVTLPPLATVWLRPA